ncbi:PH domain-containing protein [Microbacterium sp. H1-D42]|uniref:PH domain-containing protein n=1 Tax=Microbacterium sp. H1-D42 TaxID=2925844 RepID=UPI001F537F89|nr:PH domain-containing protein [Microbacterium sp. H1-D42]UNK69809.1 PH domain-containing protein [Microbacterium sp. H1-D42]
MSDTRPPRIFRVTGALVLLGLVTVVAVLLLVDAVVRSGFANMLLLAPWPLLIVWCVYVVGVVSDVRADATGVQVQNLLRRIWIPWARVKRIEMRWQLELVLDDGALVRSFGGPARTRDRRLSPGRVKEHGVAETDDGIARLNRLRAEAAASPRSDAVVVRTWDWMAIAAFGVLLLWAIVAVVVTR